jgi:hypothetical protein
MEKPKTKPKWTEQVQELEDKWLSRIAEEREADLEGTVSYAEAWAKLPFDKPIKKKIGKHE